MTWTRDETERRLLIRRAMRAVSDGRLSESEFSRILDRHEDRAAPEDFDMPQQETTRSPKQLVQPVVSGKLRNRNQALEIRISLTG